MTDIRSKKIAWPRVQRFESRGPPIITDLLTNMIRVPPVGICLILETANKPQFHYRLFYSVPEVRENGRELLLDG